MQSMSHSHYSHESLSLKMCLQKKKHSDGYILQVINTNANLIKYMQQGVVQNRYIESSHKFKLLATDLMQISAGWECKLLPVWPLYINNSDSMMLRNNMPTARLISLFRIKDGWIFNIKLYLFCQLKTSKQLLQLTTMI